jgi:hypothetical protein
MADEHVPIAGQPPQSLAPMPELGANASPVPEPSSPVPSSSIAPPATDGSDAPISRANYIARHWRGDLSLPVSYWINNFLATIAVSFVFQELGSIISISDAPLIFATIRTLVLVVAIAISIWQLVGVWRSAGKHRARGGSGFWAGVARFVLVIGFLGHGGTLTREAVPQLTQLGEIWSIAFGDSGVGKHAVHLLRNGTELEFVGGITFGVTDEVKKLLDAAPKVREINLDSDGGRVGEAHKLSELIRERGLITYVSSTCASACTIAFMGGLQRYLAPGAKLGFHRGSFPGVTDKELDQENDADRRWLIGIGVPAWFADRADSTPSSSIWLPTPDELWQAGVITGVTSLPTKEAMAAGRGSEGLPAATPELPLSGLTATATKEDIHKELQKTSLYQAIKRVEPETYHKILVAVDDAIRSGKSKAKVVALPQPFVYAVLRKHQTHASDEAIMALAELTVAEIEAVGRKDMNACYDFLFPGAAVRPVDFWEYVPPDSLERGLAAISDLTETTATNSKRAPPTKEVLQLQKLVIDGVTRRYSETFPLVLADPRSPKFSHETVCRAFGALFREVLTLPTRDRVQMLRFFFAGGSVN